MGHNKRTNPISIAVLFVSMFSCFLTPTSLLAHDNINVHPYIAEQGVALLPQDIKEEFSYYLGNWHGENSCSDAHSGISIDGGTSDEDVYSPYLDRCFNPDDNLATADVAYFNYHFYDLEADKPNGLCTYPGAPSVAEWYWNKAIEYYPSNKPLAYWYLGRVAHLLADMSVPAHVHMDPHPAEANDPDPYEEFVKNSYNSIITMTWENDAATLSPLDSSIAGNLNSLFDNLAKRSMYFPTSDKVGKACDEEWCEGWPDTSLMREGILCNPSENGPTVCVETVIPAPYYSGCTISDENNIEISYKLMPLAFQYTAALYKLFWNETHPVLTISKLGDGSGTITSNPAGINCDASCSTQSFNFDDNASVELTAFASSNSTFTGWSGSGCSGTGTCVVTMDVAKAVAATFTISPEQPPDKAVNISIDADLSWPAVPGATSYNVYFGTDSSSPSFMGNQTTLSFDPGTLQYATTYYWRIDSVNSEGTTTGNTWQFTTYTPTAEHQALIALYDSTNGAGWTNNTGWKTNSDPCTWYGVSCWDGQVRALFLVSNQLSGTIPAQIGNLTNLTNLLLGNNQLSGTIPAEIGNLSNLAWLILGENQLSGTIPAEIGSLTNLEYLYLSNNQLSGAIPSSFGNLTNLTNLLLGNNQLSGTIPAEIGNLTNLTRLILGENQLSGTIPAEIGNLTNLRYLDLSINQLSGSIPSSIGRLINLWDLDLRINQLSGGIPSSIGNLTNLTNLLLGENQLSGTIPTEIGNLTNLGSLILGENQLSGTIPAEIGNLTNLEYLYLRNNQLSGGIPSSIGNLTNLTNLLLGENQLSGTIPTEIGNLTKLTGLVLGENQLSGTIPAEIVNLTNLTTLLLGNNQLSGTIPTEIGNLINLDSLALDNNQLSGGIPSSIGNLTNLRYLDLSNNQLSGTIPAEIYNLPNLTYLNLSNNPLLGSGSGIITVDTNPDSLNAPWTLTGPNAYSYSSNGDVVIGYLDPGEYTITWGDVTDWVKPGLSTQTLAAGNSITLTGNYQLIPVVPTPPTAGFVGSNITITGSKFGATRGGGYVDFNGVHGAIVSWSDTQIVVTIPVGATSGCMTVVTDYGTSSCMDFTVKVSVKNDFNTDGIADVLLRNASTGQHTLWYMKTDGTHSSKNLLTNQNFTIVGTGDMNADGIYDILWTNTSNGQHTVWYMNADGTHIGKTLLTNMNWTVVGTGDFNTDGRTDILWTNTSTGQHSLWYMNADGTHSTKALLTNSAWSIVGTGDINGDYISDILWSNTATGQHTLWLMNTDGTHSTKALMTNAAWAIVGTGDVNEDGRSDILWRKISNGSHVLWFMNADGTQSGNKALLMDTNMVIAGTGDYNKDGIFDILWSNTSTGKHTLWYMNPDGTYSSYKDLLTNPAWTIVP